MTRQPNAIPLRPAAPPSWLRELKAQPKPVPALGDLSPLTQVIVLAEMTDWIGGRATPACSAWRLGNCSTLRCDSTRTCGLG
jgi:hypothetical protein